MHDHAAFLIVLREVTRQELLHPVRYRTGSNKPFVRLKEHVWRLSRIHRRSESHKFMWTTAMLALGLVRTHQLLADDASIHALQKFFGRKMDKSGSISHWLHRVDQAMHGYSLMYLEHYNGQGSYEKCIDETATFLLQRHARSSGGLIPYDSKHPDLMLVDTLGMICPFLAWYGSHYECNSATELAVSQLCGFIEDGLDADNALPYHAYNDRTKEKLGLCGWGRGAGWLLLGMVDSLEYLPQKHPGYDMIAEAFRCLVDVLALRQTDQGYLTWHVTDSDAHVDTSATALFGYAVARGISLHLLPDVKLGGALKALEAILRSTVDGSVGDCLVDCGGVGVYIQRFLHYPCGQGGGTALAACVCGLDHDLLGRT